MTPLPDTPILASDAEREHHVELLREHAAQGRLTIDELSERLDRAYAARTRGELAVLVEDLPARPRRPAPARPHPRRRVPAQWAAFLAVNLLLIAIWALTGAGYFWPIWPLLGWGVGLLKAPGSCHLRRLPRFAPAPAPPRRPAAGAAPGGRARAAGP
jgi:hypothetical protein